MQGSVAPPGGRGNIMAWKDKEVGLLATMRPVIVDESTARMGLISHLVSLRALEAAEKQRRKKFEAANPARLVRK